MKHTFAKIAGALAVASIVMTPALASDVSDSVTVVDDYTLQAPVDLLSGIDTGDAEGNINVVIEIPKGTDGKWEINGDNPTQIIWEFKNGLPRTVDYMGGYPANYGSVPRTAMPASFGGDGDPLDIIVLGDTLPRGEVVQVKVIAMLNLQEEDEFDGKLVAIPITMEAAAASSVSDLENYMPGVMETVASWFSSYKGPGEIELLSIGEPDEAMEVLVASANAYADQ